MVLLWPKIPCFCKRCREAARHRAAPRGAGGSDSSRAERPTHNGVANDLTKQAASLSLMLLEAAVSTVARLLLDDCSAQCEAGRTECRAAVPRQDIASRRRNTFYAQYLV